MTNYLETQLFNVVLRNTAYTTPTTVYVSLHTADPTETGAVGELTVANGYAREAVTFGAPTDGVGSNSGAVTFTAAGGAWGSITHIAIHDASAAGNSLLYSALDTSRTVNDGDTLEFAIAAISATFA